MQHFLRRPFSSYGQYLIIHTGQTQSSRQSNDCNIFFHHEKKACGEQRLSQPARQISMLQKSFCGSYHSKKCYASKWSPVAISDHLIDQKKNHQCKYVKDSSWVSILRTGHPLLIQACLRPKSGLRWSYRVVQKNQ